MFGKGFVCHENAVLGNGWLYVMKMQCKGMVGFALLSKVIAIKHLQVEIEVVVRVVYFMQEILL